MYHIIKIYITVLYVYICIYVFIAFYIYLNIIEIFLNFYLKIQYKFINIYGSNIQ